MTKIWTPEDGPVLYHYSCEHLFEDIGEEGTLLPLSHRREVDPRAWPSLFVWMTDMTIPQPDALGLTRRTLRCDRTKYRYRITGGEAIERWVDAARRLDRNTRAMLENEPGARPAHWWFSVQPVTAVYDPR